MQKYLSFAFLALALAVSGLSIAAIPTSAPALADGTGHSGG
jgi:hypothetical protein